MSFRFFPILTEDSISLSSIEFLDIFPKLVRRNMFKEFNDEQREHQLKKRGLYTEFNLVHDRGTKFGLMTGGNVDAILMSLPPIVKWDYQWQVAEGSEEARLLAVLQNPRDWI